MGGRKETEVFFNQPASPPTHTHIGSRAYFAFALSSMSEAENVASLLDQIETLKAENAMLTNSLKPPQAAPLADRVLPLVNEGAYKVLAEATELEKQGRNIVHLEIGQPDYPTPKNVVEAGMAAIAGGQTTYTNPSGTMDIKDAIATFVKETRGVEVTREEVVVGPGCKPGLFFSCMAVVNPGDEVILPDPGFPTYTNMVDVAGGKSVMCPLDKEGRCFNLEALENALNDKTRLLVVNSPSNPTGGVMTLDELKQIGALLASYPNCWVISDEIYSQLVYGEMRCSPSFLQVPELRNRLIVVDGFSKVDLKYRSKYCMTKYTF